MKNILAVFALLILLTSCNQTKIAYVDMENVMKEYQGSKDIEADMKAKSEKISSEFQKINAQFQTKVQEYQKTMNTMSASAKAKKEQELMQESQYLQQQQQMIQQQFQQEGSEMIKKISEDIQKQIGDYAKKNNYDLILGTTELTRSVVYAKEQMDITHQIIESINTQVKKDSVSVKKSETKEKKEQ